LGGARGTEDVDCHFAPPQRRLLAIQAVAIIGTVVALVHSVAHG
jgi:hypothetical protein